jgi:retron-type reverse transcriptase
MFDIQLLEDAWEHTRKGGGAPGVDGISLDTFESDLTANLASLHADMSSGAYQPQAYRVVFVPKESGGQRQLVIATLRDRVAMAAAVILLHPLLEPLLRPCSFAYRAGKGVRDALALTCQYRDRGLGCVLRADVERFFDTVLVPRGHVDWQGPYFRRAASLRAVR